MHCLRKHTANETGGTLVFVAVSLAVLIGMAALAIDLGMLFMARSEAQRAADAGALAGASAFQTVIAEDQLVPTAEARTRDYAGRNRVLGILVQPAEVVPEVFVNDGKVRATVRRQAIPLWFARIFGITTSSVGAVAVAQAQESGTTTCIAPLMVPDWWVDANTSGTYETGEYYDPLVTAYGMPYRDQGQPGYPYVSHQLPYKSDVGRPITLKAGSPNQTMQPGWYFPIRIGDNTGGSDYRADLGKGCPPRTLSIGDLVYSEPGNMTGPTKQGLNDRIAQDSAAKWVEGSGIQNSKYPLGCSGSTCTGEGSPRIMVVPLFNPQNQIPNGASAPQEIHNFGSFFMESLNGNGDIIARWMRVSGVPDNCKLKGNCRRYNMPLRLVE